MKIFGKWNESKRLTKKAPRAFFFFFLLTRKPKFIVILNGLQYQFPSSCLKQTTRGAVSAKSNSWISCSVIFIFCLQAWEIEEFTFLKLEADSCQKSIRVLYSNISKEETAEAKWIHKDLGVVWLLRKVSTNLSLDSFDFGGEKKLLQKTLDWDSQDLDTLPKLVTDLLCWFW